MEAVIVGGRLSARNAGKAGICDGSGVEFYSTDRVIVTWDHVVNAIWITICIDDAENRYA